MFGSSVCNSLMPRDSIDIMVFQYPVFGSSVCNPVEYPGQTASHTLSVPCVRVECLQLLACYAVSYAGALSVPCVRVECLQPQSIRAIRQDTQLSVPCVRVECLQLSVSSCGVLSSLTFSTLCSGRVFATSAQAFEFPTLVSFSTLCSGRVFATSSGR